VHDHAGLDEPLERLGRSADPEDTVLFTLPGSGDRPAPLPIGPVPLNIVGVPPAEGAALAAKVPNAVWEPDAGKADLIWHTRGTLVNALNMFVSFDTSAADIPGAVAAFQAARALETMAIDSKMHIVRIARHGASKAVYFDNDQLTLRIDGLAGRYLVVFNIAHDGTVQNLFPNAAYPSVAWPSRGYEFPHIDVTPPFGGDHIVAVSSPESLSGLIAELRVLEGRRDPKAAQAAVERAFSASQAARLAVASVFTAPGSKRCDPEMIQNAAMQGDCPRY
jgi:hypothetical protein